MKFMGQAEAADGHLLPAIAADQVAAAARQLPGVQPVSGNGWLRVDAAYAAQMAEKHRLVATRAPDVIAVLPGAEVAVLEMLDLVLDQLALQPGFARRGMHVRRPDGATVICDRQAPLRTLTKLLQEDVCLLEKRGDEHVLVAAALCFPASWVLAEKLGRPLLRIHRPVAGYSDIAGRVQRLFDGVQAGRPLWRANLMQYATPTLHHPRREGDPSRDPQPGYWRSERQTILRLPETRAVVFAIHTSIARI